MCKIIRGQSCGMSVKRMNVVPPNSANFSGENILDKGRGTHLAEKIRAAVFERLPSSQQGIVQFSFFWRQILPSLYKQRKYLIYNFLMISRYVESL